MERRRILQLAAGLPALAAVDAAGGEQGLVAEPADSDLQRLRDASPFHQAALPGVLDVRDHVLYDRVRVPAGEWMPKWHPMFSSPVGYNRPGSWDFKTLLDTNMHTAGHLNPPMEFSIERIVFLFNPGMAEADRNALCSNFYFEFQLDQKILVRGPLVRGAAEGVPRTYLDNFGRTAVPKRTGKRLGEELAVVLRKPIHLPSLAYWALNLHGEPFQAAADMEFYAMFDGLGVFAVQ